MDPVPAPDLESRHGEELAQVTNGIVQLFSEYYGRGPTRAKSYLLDDTFVVTVLRDTMTTVERTLVDVGHGDQVRSVRLSFQEAMKDSFKGVVEQALGRKVAAYHSQLLADADIGFELFVLEACAQLPPRPRSSAAL
ncbi:MAG: hypothetical protein QOD71_3403 [Thermoleophilaceae bacterium]|jgi:uncharacterized protein YbcI|nr:hypothetical protein [Thermoleophilaceae bacterium]